MLPGDFTIERRKIRGVVSEGMLCSARELGLGDDHDGILELPADAALGTDVREVLGLDDVVFDLVDHARTGPTRWASSASRASSPRTSGCRSTCPSPSPDAVVDALDGATVVVEAPDRCPRFVGDGRDASRWGRRRTGCSAGCALAGMRPISNVVDVTNYVMLERCRPLHAFDLGRLAGRGIVVRLADDGREDGDARRRRAHARPPTTC